MSHDEKIERIRRAARELSAALNEFAQPGVDICLRSLDARTIEDTEPRAIYELRVRIEQQPVQVYP